MSGVGSGDRLARGANKASYTTTEGGVSEQKWSDMFSDFNPEEFRSAPNKSSIRTEVSSDNTDVSTSGNVSAESPEAGPEPTA